MWPDRFEDAEADQLRRRPTWHGIVRVRGWRRRAHDRFAQAQAEPARCWPDGVDLAVGRPRPLVTNFAPELPALRPFTACREGIAPMPDISELQQELAQADRHIAGSNAIARQGARAGQTRPRYDRRA